MTTNITTIIVDDEPNSIRNLANDLVAYPEITILETHTSPQKPGFIREKLLIRTGSVCLRMTRRTAILRP